jgi:hypothetical protein
MRYETIITLSNKDLKRSTGLQRATFEKMPEVVETGLRNFGSSRVVVRFGDNQLCRCNDGWLSGVHSHCILVAFSQVCNLFDMSNNDTVDYRLLFSQSYVGVSLVHTSDISYLYFNSLPLTLPNLFKIMHSICN